MLIAIPDVEKKVLRVIEPRVRSDAMGACKGLLLNVPFGLALEGRQRRERRAFHAEGTAWAKALRCR